MKNIKLLQGFTEHFNRNLFLYAITFLFMCIGIVIGVYSVKYMDVSVKTELVKFLMSCSDNLNSESIDKKYVLYNALKNNFSIILVLWFLGLTLLGSPLILILDIIKGYTIGFTSSIIISGFGTKGVLLNLLAIFPQNLIYLPCIIISSVLAIEFSISLLKNKPMNRESNLIQILSYSSIYAFLVIIMILGVIIEIYFTPNMLKIIV